MSDILSTIACNLEPNILAAALPLLESGSVDAIEWSFDTVLNVDQIPSWYRDLLRAFQDEQRLVGHGVFYSLFSGEWDSSQEDWLNNLRQLSKEFHFDHVTEHFGFMTGEDFHKGAPLSVPFNQTTIALGRDRLKRLAEAANCPVGLENLAFAYSLDEVRRHGEFLTQLLEPVNGFMVFDLHNLYCQLHNFDVDAEHLLSLYSLDLVREIHISGGSWESTAVDPEKQVRRDTHDDSVPESVFDLLQAVIPRCPNLKYVVLEQLGIGLATKESHQQFRDDYQRMRKLVKQQSTNRVPIEDHFEPPTIASLPSPHIDTQLANDQLALSKILETATDYQDAKQQLSESPLAKSDWQVESWQPAMLETALAIAQKWRKP